MDGAKAARCSRGWSGRFDWDDGNWPKKCGKHGVSRAEIESVFAGDPLIVPDPGRSAAELRFIAVDPDLWPRPVFVVFTLRERDGVLVRPVSARYMHRGEVNYYAEALASIENR